MKCEESSWSNRGNVEYFLLRMPLFPFLLTPTSHRRDLDNAYAVELVLERVAAYFRASPDEVKKGKGVYRSIAIHLLKRWTSIPNRQIGGLLEGLSYSAVSKLNQRFSAKLSTDSRLRRTVKDITDSLSHVKG